VRVAIWARVSTDQQETANQTNALQEMARRRGWEVIKVYQVAASAWKGAHTKALTAVYQDARRGEFDLLLTWALDRLSREGIAATLEIVNRLGQYGVKVFSMQEAWTEQAGPMYELLLSVFAWVAQQESQRRSERTKAGLERVKANGTKLGRESVAGLIDLALVNKLKTSGIGWRAIAKQHPATIPTPRGGHKRPSFETIRQSWIASKNGGNGDGLILDTENSS